MFRDACVEIGFEVFLLLLNCQFSFVVDRSIDGARKKTTVDI